MLFLAKTREKISDMVDSACPFSTLRVPPDLSPRDTQNGLRPLKHGSISPDVNARGPVGVLHTVKPTGAAGINDPKLRVLCGKFLDSPMVGKGAKLAAATGLRWRRSCYALR